MNSELEKQMFNFFYATDVAMDNCKGVNGYMQSEKRRHDIRLTEIKNYDFSWIQEASAGMHS